MNLPALAARGKDWVALILSLLLSLILMNSSSHPAAERFRFGLGRVIGVVAAPVMLLPRTIEVWGENAELRTDVIRLTGERDAWREAVLENIRLRKLLGFRENPRFTYLAANVIARNPSFSMSSLLLDKGRNDSVRVGDAVVTADGLAGVIHATAKSTSVAQLATDPSFAASVRIERSRLDGILRWYRGDILMIDGVSKNQNVRVGDRVITSGLGGVIPSGIPVGVVTEVKAERGELFLAIRVRPYVAFGCFEEVFVLLPPESGEPESGENG